ncbi:PhzF family phenazine biosynthesis protein [bacterium]|nr:MAG: PhzF family phenazine biosynthesis protein [bacterium]
MNRASFYVIDAFTGELGGRTLRGNPAAVVLLDEFWTNSQMLERANEFNLSETAFVVHRGGTNFDLRWFTPSVEVALCGHATLAAARALQDAGGICTGESISFSTKSGSLTAKVEAERIELNFPVQSFEELEMPDGVAEAFGWDKSQQDFRTLYPCFWAGEDWLVCVKQEELEKARPNFKVLADVEARGVVLTSPREGEGSKIDFYSRFFGPRVGIDEDPVTGSAHTSLAPFWASRLGKKKLRAVQLSERGGLLEVELGGARVAIAGKTMIRAQGHLRD